MPRPRLAEILSAVRNDEPLGFCEACGESQTAEPDARQYDCETCGKPTVYGAEEILLRGTYDESEDSEEDQDDVLCMMGF